MKRYDLPKLVIFNLALMFACELVVMILIRLQVELSVILWQGTCGDCSVWLGAMSEVASRVIDTTHIINSLFIYRSAALLNRVNIEYIQMVIIVFLLVYIAPAHNIKMFFEMLEEHIVATIRMLIFNNETYWNGLDEVYLKELTESTQRLDTFFV